MPSMKEKSISSSISSWDVGNICIPLAALRIQKDFRTVAGRFDLAMINSGRTQSAVVFFNLLELFGCDLSVFWLHMRSNKFYFRVSQ